jgi:hypothetical protein
LYPPTVTISGDGSNATASATIGGSTITSITLTNAGDGYLTAPTVTFGGVGVDAAAATTIGTSTVTDIVITNGGSGYTTAPDLTIIDTAVVPGTGATALAVVSLETSKVNVELPPTGVTAGTYGLNTSAFKVPTFTVDTYGRLTNATEFTIPTTGVTAGTYGLNTSAFKVPTFTVDVYGRVTSATDFTIPASGVSAGTYGSNLNIPTFTVDVYGRVTSAGTNALTVNGAGGISVSTSGSTVNLAITETVVPGGSVSSSYTPNWNSGTVHTITATGNFTLNVPSNMPVGASISVIITQDGAGSRLISPSGSYKFASGLKTLSTAAGSIDFINIFNAGGGVYLAALTRGYV